MPNQTGPTTIEGKKRSSRNAWKHGIYSQAVVLPEFEDTRAWEAHCNAMFESLEPVGHLEHLLAERIAIIFWKQRRLEFHHTAMLIKTGETIISTIASTPERMKHFFRKGSGPFKLEAADRLLLMPSAWDLPYIIKYESHVHRQLLQTMHELEAIQVRRKGGHSNLARIDFTGSPGLIGK